MLSGMTKRISGAPALRRASQTRVKRHGTDDGGGASCSVGACCRRCGRLFEVESSDLAAVK
jgi:hypothetical protein